MAGEIERIKQDATYYLLPAAAGNGSTAAAQKLRDQEFNRLFFAPWLLERADDDKQEALRRFQDREDDPGYGRDGTRTPSSRLRELREDAALESFPNIRGMGITTANSSLRELPTPEPRLQTPARPGEPHPFDTLQYSAIAANTPLSVVHQAKKNSWLLVRSHTGAGWIPAQDVAFVDEPFIRRWQTGRYAALLKDDLPLSAKHGNTLFRGSVGSLFPAEGESRTAFQVLLAAGGKGKRAVIAQGEIPKTHAALKPLSLTPARIASIVNELLGKPYGWGGMNGDRDCSSTLKDLFAPFGIWLPRDSKDQAHHGGSVILKEFSPEERERKILKEARPFLTLVWMKGHIMLYIGRHEGRPVFFHNLWGIQTRTPSGEEGRFVIGRAVISTLHIGEDLPGYDLSASRFTKVEGMTFLLP